MGKRRIIMTVQDLMTTDLFTVSHTYNLLALKDIMQWARIRHIPIVDADSRLVGLVTHRNLLHASISALTNLAYQANDELLRGIPITKVMIKNVITTSPDTPLEEAARIMLQKKIGCLPVITDDTLIGILTEADFLAYAEDLPLTLTATEIMTRDLWTLRSTDNLLAVDELMKWARIRHVPVVNGDNNLIGLVTHRDLLHTSLSSIVGYAPSEERKAFHRTLLKRIMKKQVTTVSGSAPVSGIARLMRSQKIGCVPVLDEDDHLAGIVTEVDILHLIEQNQLVAEEPRKVHASNSHDPIVPFNELEHSQADI